MLRCLCSQVRVLKNVMVTHGDILKSVILVKKLPKADRGTGMGLEKQRGL